VVATSSAAVIDAAGGEWNQRAVAASTIVRASRGIKKSQRRLAPQAGALRLPDPRQAARPTP